MFTQRQHGEAALPSGLRTMTTTMQHPSRPGHQPSDVAAVERQNGPVPFTWGRAVRHISMPLRAS
jgi:hypothetical protein